MASQPHNITSSDEILKDLKTYFENMDAAADRRVAPDHYRDQALIAENRLRDLIGLPMVTGRKHS